MKSSKAPRNRHAAVASATADIQAAAPASGQDEDWVDRLTPAWLDAVFGGTVVVTSGTSPGGSAERWTLKCSDSQNSGAQPDPW